MTRRILLVACITFPLLAQPSPDSPTFEVASIKRADPSARGVNIQFTPGGGVRMLNVNLRQAITMAYDLQRFQLSGGPGWIDSDRFDIVAKAPANAGNDQAEVRKRLQALLAERFQLQVHRESKETLVFALVVAKNGPKVKASTEGQEGINMRPGRMESGQTEIEILARVLSGIVGRLVIDRTGLKGTYAFKLEWTPEQGGPVPPEKAEAAGAIPSDGSAPSIFNALQEQLGLKLESQKASVASFVVARAEKPTEN